MGILKFPLDYFLPIIILITQKVISQKVNFKENEIDSSPTQIIYCGYKNKSIIILTELNGIYLSENNGFYFKKLNDIFINKGKDELEESSDDIGKIYQIIQNPKDNNLTIFLGTSGINYIGENCGNNITAINHGRRINEFIFHPTERNWALASAYTICDDFINEPCKLYKEVFVTLDLGLSWKQIGKYVVQVNWGIVEKEQIGKGIPKERILMSYEPRGLGNQKFDKWNYKIDLIYSDDFFESFTILVEKGNKFFLTNHYLFVASVIDQETQEVLLLGGKSTHFQYDLIPIETNQKSYIEHNYIFLDWSFHSVFLHINHFGEKFNYGNIYTSGARGLKYSLSLKNNVRGEGNKCDFEKVNSVEGVYIANVVSGKYIKYIDNKMKQNFEIVNKNKKINKNTSNKNNINNTEYSNENFTYKDFIKTVITNNKGGKWERIKAPEKDSEGKKYNCGDYCYLNLFGPSSDNPPFYSVESASGIIISNGNIGHYLKYNESSTFLSRDGGLNWFEIKKGSHIYEIGDGGGLILIAENNKLTNLIQFTWDEGLTWEKLIISEEKIYIVNIVNEKNTMNNNFIIYGYKIGKNYKKGIVIGINFNDYYEKCKLPNEPNNPLSDYEIWSINNNNNSKCLLGHKIQIIRRKRESKCINSEKFRKIIKENCKCTEEDYQCDMGYERYDIGEPCLKIDNNNKIDIPLICNDNYIVSKGYRKIAGDTCEGGIDLNPYVVDCPGNFKVLKHFNLIFGIGIFLVVFIIFYFTFEGENFEGKLNQILNKFNNDNNYTFNNNIQQQKSSYINLSDENDDDEINPINI